MGQFTIVIHGTGAHHNWATTDGPDGRSGYIKGRANDHDADLLFAEFVDQLKARGHTITGATFTVGGMEGADNIIRREYVNPHLAVEQVQVDNFPRRNRMDYWSPAELAIQVAVDEVERAGAGVRLTDAVNLLAKARAAVADYIDSQPDPLRFKAGEAA